MIAVFILMMLSGIGYFVFNKDDQLRTVFQVMAILSGWTYFVLMLIG